MSGDDVAATLVAAAVIGVIASGSDETVAPTDSEPSGDPEPIDTVVSEATERPARPTTTNAVAVDVPPEELCSRRRLPGSKHRRRWWP